MIVGIGVDVCDSQRIGRVLDRFGERFLERVYTDAERRRARRSRDPVPALARRWAAKEACSKALGSGLRMGIAWREFAVDNLATGQPSITLSGAAARRLSSLLPPGHDPRIHVSLSDERNCAVAAVVIEALLGRGPE